MPIPAFTGKPLSKKGLVSIAVLATSLLTTPTLAAKKSAAADTPPSIEQMAKNHAYQLLVGERSISLKNGKFSDVSSPEKAISASLVKFAASDLNDDGRPDCVVIIEHHGMGSGAFFELSALVSNSGDYVQTKPILLGDNVEIGNLEIFESTMWRPKEISIAMLVHQGTDAHARPTLRQQRCYYLEGSELRDCHELPIVKKPAVYLYPKHQMKVKVTLAPQGTVVKSIPEYGSGWTVKAKPDGTIDGRYGYLFYEASLDKPLPLPKEGWSVKRKDLGEWFDENLKKLGLNRQESKDLRKYWVENLTSGKYCTIRIVNPEVVSERLGLNIEPKPDSVLRLLLHFTPTDSKEHLKAPEIRSFHRKGFTVVEWGGLVSQKENESRVR